jgi:flagellar motor switch protein FliN/FliY
MRPPGLPSQHLGVDDLKEVRLQLTADLGECMMTVRQVLQLKEGSILALGKLAGEMTDIRINDVLMARGEIVVIGDELHIRVGEVIGVGEREQENPSS